MSDYLNTMHLGEVIITTILVLGAISLVLLAVVARMGWFKRKAQ